MSLLNNRDGRLVLVGFVLGVLLAGAGVEAYRLFGAPSEAPAAAIAEARVDARTEDVRRGRVTVTRHVEVKPDGTRTTDSVRTEGPMVSRTETLAEAVRQEIPAPPQEHARTRYVGLGVDPADYARLPRLRAGVTLWERLDAGLAYDPRRSIRYGALSIEAAWRF